MKTYTIEGKIYNSLPDPLYTADGSAHSPMTEDRFRALGGEIEDDGEPTPQERICASFAALITDLAQKTDKITPEEFLAAAQNGISSDLIDFAREREVPEEVIAEGRARIVEIMADALRFGMTWAELIAGVTPQA